MCSSSRASKMDSSTQTEWSRTTMTIPSSLSSSSSSSSSSDDDVPPFQCLANEHLQDNGHSDTDSLLCRIKCTFSSLLPSLGGVRDCGTQTSCDPLIRETRRLAFDVVYLALGRRAGPSEETSACLWTCVRRMNERHDILINAMVNKIDLDMNSENPESNHRHQNFGNSSRRLKEGYRQLCDELFSHNEVSWAKIVALFAFSARLAVRLSDREDAKQSGIDVASNLADVAVQRLTPFLRNQGGWTTLCEVFPVDSDYESHLWHSLVVAGVGLTAMATLIALKR